MPLLYSALREPPFPILSVGLYHLNGIERFGWPIGTEQKNQKHFIEGCNSYPSQSLKRKKSADIFFFNKFVIRKHHLINLFNRLKNTNFYNIHDLLFWCFFRFFFCSMLYLLLLLSIPKNTVETVLLFLIMRRRRKRYFNPSLPISLEVNRKN